MFLPVGDDTPRERPPWVNYLLLAANLAAFFLLCFPAHRAEATFAVWALKPSEFRWPTLFSSMFLHAGLIHLAGNMLFLWIFGDNVEDRLGHAGYALFYLGCGLAAGLVHRFTTASPHLPTVGASGAISGVLGAYLVFFPFNNVKILFWFWFYVRVLYVSAFWWIGFWFFQQIFLASLGGGPVAYAAHLGGFVAGAFIALLIRAIRHARIPDLPLPRGIREASRISSFRSPVVTIHEDVDAWRPEEPADRYAVLRLTDTPFEIPRLARLSAEILEEDPGRIGRRLYATRGMIARDLERTEAERLQRHLRSHGFLSILAPGSRRPPPRIPAEAVAWDDHFLRFTVGNEVSTILWTVPFLYLGARVGPAERLDIFVNGQLAFGVSEECPLAWIVPHRALEIPAELDDLARAVLHFRRGAVVNEGVHVLAHRGLWGWLHFRNPDDYEDYVFWIYHLVLSRVPLHRM